ncbi:hypothetical protein BD626DRAFT_506143 [Schizophyllum amplum]|uniref:Protein HRI1 n=1 Tax=Schizophyllum amplum TaxID=97359 RepID=A0A550C5E4_9AGAR|nr:hypothetical protein BD626DRAFT_506143 [Auriculariopsis ampla]
MPGFVSFREGFRWLLDELDEPTLTIVLSGKDTGAFVDVRFLQTSASTLEWAFAGFRHAEDRNRVRFEHLLDSRTTNPASIIDAGTMVELSKPGRSLERGSMINPETGRYSPYEEVWQEEAVASDVAIVRRRDGQIWKARVGDWQLEVGRDERGCWAWQARRPDGCWEIVRITKNASAPYFLPNDRVAVEEWAADGWEIIECS